MKRFLVSATVFLCSIFYAYSSVKVTISDGIDDTSLKTKMELSVSALLSEIDDAEKDNRALNLASINMDHTASRSLEMLWENCHFLCTDSEIVEHCIETYSGYQIRNIPLLMKPGSNGSFDGSEYQEAVIGFDKSGNIGSFYLTINTNLYMNVIRSDMELTDLRRRQLILDYVEQFRTSYNQKDIHFLEQVFSDDALIITGKVIQQLNSDNIKLPDKILYKKQTKRQYIENLKKVFASNSYIRATFDDIKVRRHPSNADFYGVTLHQGYTSSNYHDDGYLFLLWDFSREDYPQIHVRTWQPDEYNGNRIADEEVFSLEDFDI